MNSNSKIETGFLKYWNTRGYGIIRTTPNDLGVWREVFVHVTSISSGDPIVGSRAEFIIGGKTKGFLLPALQVKFSPKVEITDAMISTLTVAVS
jgi:hypothetical protein